MVVAVQSALCWVYTVRLVEGIVGCVMLLVQAAFRSMCEVEEKVFTDNNLGRTGSRYIMNESLPVLTCVLAHVLEEADHAAAAVLRTLSQERKMVVARISGTPGALVIPATLPADVFRNAEWLSRHCAAIKGMFFAAGSNHGYSFTAVLAASRAARRAEPGNVDHHIDVLRLLSDREMVRKVFARA
jgi:hypothetical protein